MFKLTRFLVVLTVFAFTVVGSPAPAAEAPALLCSSTVAETSDSFELLLEVAARAFCSADCQGAGTASCSGATCRATNRDCSVGQPGFARCNNTTYFCDPCPGPVCNPSCDDQCGPTGGLCLSNGTCACY